MRKTIDNKLKRAILDTRRIIQEAEKADCNEADTRRRIERIFELIMGYDPFKHLSRERAVRGAGETEHVDFAIHLDEGENAKPEIMVEIKRVNVDLATKHLRQVSSYAINAGCEWILLTNSKEWRLYHVSFGQPPITKLIHSWNILTDDVPTLADRFELISLKSLKKGVLDDVWQKTNVLHPRNLIQAILSENSMKDIRRELKRDSGILLSPDEILGGVRRLLNETALAELEGIRITFSGKRSKRSKPRARDHVESADTNKNEKSTSTDSETISLNDSSTLPKDAVE